MLFKYVTNIRFHGYLLTGIRICIRIHGASLTGIWTGVWYLRILTSDPSLIQAHHLHSWTVYKTGWTKTWNHFSRNIWSLKFWQQFSNWHPALIENRLWKQREKAPEKSSWCQISLPIYQGKMRLLHHRPNRIKRWWLGIPSPSGGGCSVTPSGEEDLLRANGRDGS